MDGDRDTPLPRGSADGPRGVGAGPVHARVGCPGVESCRPSERSRLPGRSARHSDHRGPTGGFPGGDRERPLAPRSHGGRPNVHRLPAADREVGRHAPPRARGRLGRERGVAAPALRRRVVLRASRGGQGQPAGRPRRLPGRQGRVPVGARPGCRLPEGARAASAPGGVEDLARPGPGRARHHRGPAGRRRQAAAGQERAAARHRQHDAGAPGPRGRQAGPPSGRGIEPSAGRQLVGAHPRRREGRQALPAGGGTVVRGRHPRRPVGRRRAAARRARRRHADRGEEPAGEPPRRPRPRGEGRGRAGRGPDRLRQHGAGRADPDAGPARLRAHRGHRPPPRPKLVREHRARPGGPAPLHPSVGTMVPQRVPGRGPVGIRRARQAARGLRPHPRDSPPGRGSRFGARARRRPRRPSSTTASPRPPR